MEVEAPLCAFLTDVDELLEEENGKQIRKKLGSWQSPHSKTPCYKALITCRGRV